MKTLKLVALYGLVSIFLLPTIYHIYRFNEWQLGHAQAFWNRIEPAVFPRMTSSQYELFQKYNNLTGYSQDSSKTR